MLVAMCTGDASLLAQQNLLNFLPESGIQNLSEDQQNRLSRIEAIEGAQATWLVDVSHPSSLVPLGHFVLDLPDVACSPKLVTSVYEAVDDTTMYYSAEVVEPSSPADSSCFDGHVSLVYSGSSVTGSIVEDGRTYELYSIGGGLEVLVSRISPEDKINCGNSYPLNESSDSSSQALVLTHEPCGPIRLLILYTAAAAERSPDVVGVARTVHQHLREIYRNSRVPISVADVVLVGINPVQHGSNLDHNVDIDNLIMSPFVKDERRRAFADIVLVLTAFPVENFYRNEREQNVAGIAGTLTLQADDAIAAVMVNQALHKYTGVHEISHLFGCRHERADDVTGNIEHAWELRLRLRKKLFNRDRHTVMWANSADANSIAHLSNPFVEYSNVSTGTGMDNNAQQVSNAGCTVAEFALPPPPPPFSIRIDGETQSCGCNDLYFEAVATPPAAAPFTFAWQHSFDGINYGPVESTASWYSPVLDCSDFLYLFVRVTVTDRTGQSLTRVHRVRLLDRRPGSGIPCRMELRLHPGVPSALIRAYPNPVEHNLVLLLPEGIDPEGLGDPVTVDASGRRVAISNSVEVLDATRVRVDVSGLPAGSYVLHFEGAPNATVKFIKQ